MTAIEAEGDGEGQQPATPEQASHLCLLKKVIEDDDKNKCCFVKT